MLVRRLLAYVIDWYLISFAMNMVLVAAACAVTGIFTASSVPITGFASGLQLVLFLCLAVLDLVYFCLLPCFVLSGQTVGKRLLRLRVERVDGSQAALGNYLLRDFLGLVVVEGCFSPLSNYLRNIMLLWLSRDVVQVIIWAGIVIGVISAGIMLLTCDRRMIHDLIGGTRVVLVERVQGGGNGHQGDGTLEQPLADGDGRPARNSAAD